jgi:DNA-binding protein YbaB
MDRREEEEFYRDYKTLNNNFYHLKKQMDKYQKEVELKQQKEKLKTLNEKVNRFFVFLNSNKGNFKNTTEDIIDYVDIKKDFEKLSKEVAELQKDISKTTGF